MNRRAVLAGLAGVLLADRAHAAVVTTPLFHIGRNKNANLVQYDAVVVGPTRLHSETPVIASWIMLAEDGRREKLSALDKRAYGFETRPEGVGSCLLNLKAVPSRTLRVLNWRGRWVAQALVNGRSTVLVRVFVTADESGFVPSVRWIDLFGVDMLTGEPVTERLRP